MDSIAVHGWQAPLVVRSSDEMYGMVPSKSLPSVDFPSLHGWWISMWYATSSIQYLNFEIRWMAFGDLIEMSAVKARGLGQT